VKEEEGDLLDNILDDFEEKKGIESTKQKKDSSFGSQNNQAFNKSGNGGGGQASARGDPWGREVLDDLDDFGDNEETKSKKNGGAAATQ
jgi:hypothetical protein